jgi:signal transduction histidine kinase
MSCISLNRLNFEGKHESFPGTDPGTTQQSPTEIFVQKDTEFLPVEKLPPSDVFEQHQSLFTSDLLKIVEVLPVTIVILNDHRQIVYGNNRFLSLIGVSRLHDVLGKRLGEAAGCIHSMECQAECGTTRFCRHCGAARAIVSSLAGGSDIEQCNLSRKVGSATITLNLQVSMSPLQHADRNFCAGVLVDIENEMQKQQLERMFFHDILNTCGAIHGICELSNVTQLKAEMLKKLTVTSGRLIEQILSHRDFTLAEKHELPVHPVRVGCLSILEEQLKLFDMVAEAGGVKILLSENRPEVFIETDRTLIGRVLGNLIKNAMEASSRNDVVSIDCLEQDYGVLFAVRNPAVLPESVRAGLFKRSFSTKGIGRGLGTYGAKLLIEVYLDGRIWFESYEEIGTTFYIRLPHSIHSKSICVSGF